MFMQDESGFQNSLAHTHFWKNFLTSSSIHNYSILFFIIMKDEKPKVFNLVKTKSALDFLKNNTSSSSISERIILDKFQGIMF